MCKFSEQVVYAKCVIHLHILSKVFKHVNHFWWDWVKTLCTCYTFSRITHSIIQDTHLRFQCRNIQDLFIVGLVKSMSSSSSDIGSILFYYPKISFTWLGRYISDKFFFVMIRHMGFRVTKVHLHLSNFALRRHSGELSCFNTPPSRLKCIKCVQLIPGGKSYLLFATLGCRAQLPILNEWKKVFFQLMICGIRC